MSFTFAFVIGFSVASIPGPTIILISTETLRKGARAGLLTMLAPLLMDAIIMLPLGLFLQASIFSGKGAVALGFIGAMFLVWLGLQSMQARTTESVELKTPSDEMPSFLKGVLTHLTSPYPYLYWGTVGSTFVWQGYENGGFSAAVVFPLGFWLGAILLTLLVIYVVARGKRLLPARFEPHLHRTSGVLLVGSGIYLALRIWQGRF